MREIRIKSFKRKKKKKKNYHFIKILPDYVPNIYSMLKKYYIKIT